MHWALGTLDSQLIGLQISMTTLVMHSDAHLTYFKFLIAYIDCSKGQKISKANSLVLIFSRKPTDILQKSNDILSNFRQNYFVRFLQDNLTLRFSDLRSLGIFDFSTAMVPSLLCITPKIENNSNLTQIEHHVCNLISQTVKAIISTSRTIFRTGTYYSLQ